MHIGQNSSWNYQWNFFSWQYLTKDRRKIFPMRFHTESVEKVQIERLNSKLKSENSIEKMSERVNFRWNNIISNNFSTFLECFDSRDLWLAIKISRKIEHRTSACRQFHRNRIYFLLSIWKLNLIQRSNQRNFHCNEKFVSKDKGYGILTLILPIPRFIL